MKKAEAAQVVDKPFPDPTRVVSTSWDSQFQKRIEMLKLSLDTISECAERDDMSIGNRRYFVELYDSVVLEMSKQVDDAKSRALLDGLFRTFCERMYAGHPELFASLELEDDGMQISLGYGSARRADASDFDKRVGARLAKARNIREFTVSDAASRLSISSQALYKYERGERTIKAKLVYDAARLYKVDSNWLMCLTDVLHINKRDDDGYFVTTTYRAWE